MDRQDMASCCRCLNDITFPARRCCCLWLVAQRQLRTPYTLDSAGRHASITSWTDFLCVQRAHRARSSGLRSNWSAIFCRFTYCLTSMSSNSNLGVSLAFAQLRRSGRLLSQRRWKLMLILLLDVECCSWIGSHIRKDTRVLLTIT